MQIRYAATIDKKSAHGIWSGTDSSVFDKVSNCESFNKEIYFYPSTPPEQVWLWSLGHEKATANKAIMNRIWHTRWVFHMCISGKGYYNDKPIKRGTCFLTWPYFKHSIVSDAEDPFEYYWLILRGEDMMDFVHENGFRNTRMLFETNNVDEIEKLFKLGMESDYTKTNVYKYTMSLVNMIFSYYQPYDLSDEDSIVPTEYGNNHISMARQLLRDSNYSMPVSELAKKLGLNANYLGKLFLREKGETLKGYIIRKRFEAAEKFLQKGMPPSEVARVIGYNDYPAFCHMFVSRYSMKPTEYVKHMVKKNE